MRLFGDELSSEDLQVLESEGKHKLLNTHQLLTEDEKKKQQKPKRQSWFKNQVLRFSYAKYGEVKPEAFCSASSFLDFIVFIWRLNQQRDMSHCWKMTVTALESITQRNCLLLS